MQSKTSFFNKTVLKKDITRFAPIWALYTVFLLLMLFEYGSYPAAITASNLLELFTGDMVITNALYAGVCAAFLFMDLFNGRLCNALHAFPLQRKNWLANHLLSGFLFSLVPNLLATLVAIPMLWEYAYIAPILLAVTTLQFLFFFGSAVLCAMCAGNLIGMAALYGIFHLGVVLIGGIAELFYQPLLHGVELTIDSFAKFIPLYQMNNFKYAAFEVIHQKLDPYGVFNGLIGKDWLYLGLCAVAGAVCIWLAWLVYRKRTLEAAGDLLAVKQLSPLFLLICTVGAGAILFLFSGAFGIGSYVFLIVGSVVGYFAGRMLLNRTVKVFTKRAFLGFGIIAAVAGASFLLTWLDPVGVTRYVPELDQIESAAVIGADKGHYFYPTSTNPMRSYNGGLNSTSNFKITDPQELADIQDFHRQLISYRPSKKNQDLCEVTVSYTLKCGRVLTRCYEVERNAPLGERAGKYFNDIRYIFEVNDATILYEIFGSVTINHYNDDGNSQIKLTDKQEIAGLLDAVKADCEAGVMAQNYAYHSEYIKDDDKYLNRNYNITFNADDTVIRKTNWNGNRVHLEVYPDSTNTIAYLQQMVTAHWDEVTDVMK